jgi:hypothetical protein
MFLQFSEYSHYYFDVTSFKLGKMRGKQLKKAYKEQAYMELSLYRDFVVVFCSFEVF